ncbi:MAG: DNA/RNA non-specific endonuclease [Paludibacteraceae bacterium]|nr:DNA/RNA non-specific endonuclease [Paludibacteraceae bacterium]
MRQSLVKGTILLLMLMVAGCVSARQKSLLYCDVPKGVSSQVLVREGYVTSYNKDTRLPNWVAWRLTKERMESSVSGIDRKMFDFHRDDEVENPVEKYDYHYKQTGYERGHMCPYADCKWSMKAADETFLMTNICPQGEELNNGRAWKSLERKCRKWAADGLGDIYIVTGPIVSRDCETIGSGIAVPKAFYKVVLRFDGKRAEAFGVMYRNVEGGRIQSSIHSIDGIERLTKLDFFSALPDVVEKRVESAFDIDVWPGLRDIIERE